MILPLTTCLLLSNSRYVRSVTVQVSAVNALGASLPSRSVAGTLPCRTGYGTIDSGRTECVRCSLGTAAPSGLSNGISGAECSRCGIGTVAATEGSTTCTPCAIGTYQDQRGMASCQVHPRVAVVGVVKGSDANTTEGLSARGYPQDIPSGTVTPIPGAASFTVCEAGTAVSADKTTCEPCAEGHASGGPASDACEMCPAGS